MVVALVAVSAVLWSTAGLFVRLAHLDVWTLVAWRSEFSALTLGIYVLVRNRRSIGLTLASIGRPGLVAIPISVISSISYVGAGEAAFISLLDVILGPFGSGSFLPRRPDWSCCSAASSS